MKKRTLRNFVPAIAVLLGTLAPFSGCQNSGGQPLRFEVELMQDASGVMNAKIAPDESFNSATLVSGSTKIWEVSAPATAPEPAGTYLAIGTAPSGWSELTPFAGFEEGQSYTLTLANAQDKVTASATWTYRLAPVNPELSLTVINGEVTVRTTPVVPVAKVVLNSGGATPAALWTANAPSANGVLFPVEGFVIGNAPPSWSAIRAETNGVLQEGAPYSVDVTIPAAGFISTATTLHGTFTFREGAPEQYQLSMDHSVAVNFAASSSDSTQIYQFGARPIAFVGAYNTTSLNSGTIEVDDLLSSNRSVLIGPTPNFGYVGQNANGLLNSGSMSPVLPHSDGSISVAQVMSSGSGVMGGIYVLESAVPAIHNFGGPQTENWSAGWSIVGGSAPGSFLGGQPVPRLLMKNVSGLTQSATKPYVVAAFDYSNNFGMYYLGAAGTWSTLSTSGILAAGEILSNIDLAVSDDGQLYSCASVTNGGSVSAFRISQFSSATNLWTTIATNPNGYNFTNPGDTDACRMASSGNVVYAAAVGSDSTLWVRQIQGSAVSAINFDSTSILGANHFPFSLMDIRASAQGPFIALTDLVKTTADGSTPYLGSNTYLLNSDGTSWGIVHAARAPVDTSLGKVVGITRLLISQDLRSLFATGLAASTGGVNSGNVSLWHLGN